MPMPERGTYNDQFDAMDYGSYYITLNLGCVFLVFLWQFATYLIYFVLLIVSLRFAWPNNMIKKMKGTLFWR